MEPKTILRPEVSVAQVILLMLSQRGPMTFAEILAHPSTILLGAQRTANSFYTALARLKRTKRVIRTGHTYELTGTGHFAALKAYARKEIVEYENKPVKPVPWDGKWRIIFFDMPEAKRFLRDYLRRIIGRLGFIEFQRSIWISPYKPPVFLKNVFQDPSFRDYTKLIIAHSIDYDEDLRQKFKIVR